MERERQPGVRGDCDSLDIIWSASLCLCSMPAVWHCCRSKRKDARVCVYGCMHACMHACMYVVCVCVCVCVYVCMYVCMYACM